MAINKVPQTTQLVIKLQTGLNAAGKPVFKRRSFKNVKTAALDADIFAVGQAIAALQDYPAVDISRVDEDSLVSE